MSFFFSSRRRHTRVQGDWSSDVCSSDLLVGKIQRSVVSTHPEKRDPTNCVRGENPRIAVLVLNRLWIPRFRPSGRCIHASLLNMLNLTCAQATDLPTSPHLGGYALNCTPERARNR